MENSNYQSTHHIKVPKGADAEKIIRETVKEVDTELNRIKRMDNDEMMEIEKWQVFIWYNFLK